MTHSAVSGVRHARSQSPYTTAEALTHAWQPAGATHKDHMRCTQMPASSDARVCWRQRQGGAVKFMAAGRGSCIRPESQRPLLSTSAGSNTR